jgi:hypothetical protein
MEMTTEMECEECGRFFDLRFGEQAEEWFYGHDCEVA